MNENIVEAVNLLIDAPDYSALVQQMTRFIEDDGPDRVVFRDERACLGAMVALGVDDRNAFERLLKLIDAKRQENPKTAKLDYQRDHMRERRQRMAKALLLHEARSGPLQGPARKVETDNIRKRWTRAKAQFIVDRAPTTGAERMEATRAFWAMVDRQLDANIANLHRTHAVA